MAVWASGALLVVLVTSLSDVAGSCPAGRYGYRCTYQCHCPQIYCNSTSGCQPSICSRGWSGPTCQKENIAIDKHTSASSVFSPPSNAVDGNTTGNRCFHSVFNDASITSAWWRVDLGQQTLVRDVIIYFRTDNKIRRNGIQIYIADTVTSPTDGVNCYIVTGNSEGTDIPDVLKVTCSSEGRYLVLYTTTKNSYDTVPMLDFCEVEANVCGPGTFGADCDNYCHCDGDLCNYVSGVCPRGICLPGWQTESCDTVCDPGTFGTNCSNSCHCDGVTCDHVTGICPSGVCQPGWKTDTCDTECDTDSYGSDCSEACSKRNCKGDNSSCDHVAGVCVEGCKAGWDGTDCTQELRNVPDSISLVIGVVVGVVLTLLLAGGAHLYLLRTGRLTWMHGPGKEGERQDKADTNISQPVDNYTSMYELPRTGGDDRNVNNYAGLDAHTRGDNKLYDVIQN